MVGRGRRGARSRESEDVVEAGLGIRAWVIWAESPAGVKGEIPSSLAEERSLGSPPFARTSGSLILRAFRASLSNKGCWVAFILCFGLS